MTPGDLLRHSIDHLLRGIESGDANHNEHFKNAFRALGALPLPTGDFGQAVNNLRNAHVYVQSEEAGAAAFELSSLQRRLLRICRNVVPDRQARVIR